MDFPRTMRLVLTTGKKIEVDYCLGADGRAFSADIYGPGTYDANAGLTDVETSEVMSGPEIVGAFRCFRSVAKAFDQVSPRFARFFEEHDVHVKPGDRETVEQFQTWLHEQVRALRPAYKEFLAQYKRDLVQDKEEIERLAREWSVVDADGLH